MFLFISYFIKEASVGVYSACLLMAKQNRLRQGFRVILPLEKGHALLINNEIKNLRILIPLLKAAGFSVGFVFGLLLNVFSKKTRVIKTLVTLEEEGLKKGRRRLKSKPHLISFQKMHSEEEKEIIKELYAMLKNTH